MLYQKLNKIVTFVHISNIKLFYLKCGVPSKAAQGCKF